MSRQDLEDYWNKREAFTANPSIEASYDPEKMAEFLAYKERVEADLEAKDARAMRAVRVSGQISRGEAGYVAAELYPNPSLRPDNAALLISLHTHRKVCMQLYDIFVGIALDTATQIAPL